MGYGRYVGRVGALAVATRMAVSVSVAALVVAAMTPTAPEVRLSASSPPCTDTAVTCALILGGTSVPTPDQFYLDAVRDNFVGPLFGQNVTYVPVTAPQEFWPITGAGRVLWLVLGPPEIWGPGGSGWPDEPVWKLTGFFDLTFDQSVAQGVTDLETEMAKHPGETLVIFGYSQGAIIANMEKQKLAEQYPEGTEAPDIEFVLIGDPNVPNGGLAARFPGLYIPIVNFSFNGPEPTDTQFHTTVDISAYDGAADFPLYPINLFATGNALLGAVYVHPRDLEPSVDDPGTIHTTYGDTDYYFHPTDDLPLFEPLRMFGVPEPVIDVFEPVVKEVVELGYDRTIPPGEPTPARLIPPIRPVEVVHDLANAVGEGITNAAALIDAPKPPAVTHDDLTAPQRAVGGEPATTRDRLNAAIGTVKSVIGNGRPIVRSARGDNGSNPATTSPARKTPVRDAIKNASTGITKVVTKVSDRVKQALSGGNDDDTGDGGEGAAP
jgi:PE-PPE domain